ncbi:hypothetical protein N9164_03395 [Draconibacterium sp.]|nr:hypothetical protein [Draconibacterium sp.]
MNSKISMQHNNYKTTSKHYVDKREIAKQMVENSFRIFPEKNKGNSSRALQP